MADPKTTPAPRGGVIQKAPPVNASDLAAKAISDAEEARKAEAAPASDLSHLPASVLAEMQAGKDALARHATVVPKAS